METVRPLKRHTSNRFKDVRPLTTRSGLIVFGLSRLLYDIVLQFEMAGIFPTIQEIEALSPSSPSNKLTAKTIRKMLAEGVLEKHPVHVLKQSQRIRIAGPGSPQVFSKLTPSGIYVRGRELRWVLLIEGFEALFGHPPHIEDLAISAGITRRRARMYLNNMARKGILCWVDNKHICIARKK